MVPEKGYLPTIHLVTHYNGTPVPLVLRMVFEQIRGFI